MGTRTGLLAASFVTVVVFGLSTAVLSTPPEGATSHEALTLDEFVAWLDEKVEVERHAVRHRLIAAMVRRDVHEAFVTRVDEAVRRNHPWLPDDASYQEYLGYLMAIT